MLAAGAVGDVQLCTPAPAGGSYAEEVESKGFRRQDVVMEKEGMNFGIIKTWERVPATLLTSSVLSRL